MTQGRAKYGNRLVDEGGQRYHSVLELDVARALDLLVQQGRVERYGRQIPFELAPHRGRERSVVYRADFAVHLPGNSLWPSLSGLVEAKGYLTEGGRLKLRWLREKYPAIRLWVVHDAGEVLGVVEQLERAAHDAQQEDLNHDGP